MKSDNFFDDLLNLNLQPEDYPHGSNLATKIRNKRSLGQSFALQKVVPCYLRLNRISRDYENGQLALNYYLMCVDEYFDLLSSPFIKQFSHQSDFVSSVLPEVLCSLFRRAVKEISAEKFLHVTAQKDIVIECNFDISGGGRIIEKRKRMDLAVLLSGTLTFNDIKMDFKIPAVCAEIKTNIDKNMLSGIESSVETLKRTFPRVKYFAIGEYSDFEIKSQNYAATSIDEILIVRLQKRAAVRKLPSARNPLCADLLVTFIDDMKKHIETTAKPHCDLADRLLNGRLT